MGLDRSPKVAHILFMDEFHRPRKHSLTLKGHRTSVSLEDPFWQAFVRISKQRGLAINELAGEIDTRRGADCGLASAIRLYVLEYLTRDQA
jgi:predicted DNA-binding ribbon-helix-helix protein